MGEGGLADARNVFDQEVPAGEQCNHCERDDVGFPADDPLDVCVERRDLRLRVSEHAASLTEALGSVNRRRVLSPGVVRLLDDGLGERVDG